MKIKWSAVRFLLLSMLLVMPTQWAQAEETTNVLSFEELQIQVMPEFSYHPEDKKQDQPALLVGYHGSLMNKSDQPQKGKIEIPLPMKEKNFRIGFVADYNREGTEMLEIEYELDKKNGVMTWETHEEIQPGEMYKFVIEYYTDQITAKVEAKKLKYSFSSFANIGLVSITFLEPLKTESFTIAPAAEEHQQNPYGMNMFMYQLQGVKPGQKQTYEVNYSRAEKTPTMDIINDMAGQSTTKDTTVKENKTMSTELVTGVVVGSSLFLGSLLIILLRKRKPQAAKKSLKDDSRQEKVRRLRAMLVDGSITEEEYEQLMKKMGA